MLKKSLWKFLIMTAVLFLFSMPIIAQTNTDQTAIEAVTAAESPDQYGDMQCLDYSFADFEKDLTVMKVATNKTLSKTPVFAGSGSMDHDTDKLNTSSGSPNDRDSHRTNEPVSGKGDFNYSLTYRADHGPAFSKHHAIE